MKIKHAVPVVAALSLVLAAPALAGGAHCAGKTSAAVAGQDQSHCSGKSSSAAWAGAWLERSEAGALTVAAVAKGSPAARSGLKSGDVVVAVNGRQSSSKGACLSNAECAVGSSVAFTVQRGRSTKVMKVKLEKMPAEATERFAHREASFDPTLASVVFPAVN